MSTTQLQAVIDLAWESRSEITAINAPEVRDAVEHVIAELNGGRLRVAARRGVGDWQGNQWLKKAVLLSFRLNDNKVMRERETRGGRLIVPYQTKDAPTGETSSIHLKVEVSVDFAAEAW